MLNINPANESNFSILTKRLYRAGLCVLLLANPLCHAREIALTFDDAPTPDSALMTGDERTTRLIAALQHAKVPDALFFVKAGTSAPCFPVQPRIIKRLIMIMPGNSM